MTDGVSVGALDHYNLRTRKHQETVRFYEEVLGLVNGPRPNLPFPGAWLYSEGRPVLHLVDISPTDEVQKPDSGVVDHVAFACRGFRAMKERLARLNIVFDARQPPGSALWRIFVTDPNGVVIELNYQKATENAQETIGSD